MVTKTPTVVSPKASPEPQATALAGNDSGRALELDGFGDDAVKFNGEGYDFTALPVRVEARIKLNESLTPGLSRFEGDTVLAKDEAIAFFAALAACPDAGMALVIDDGDPVCGPKVQRGVWKDIGFVYDGETVTFLQGGKEVEKRDWQSQVPLENGLVVIGRSSEGITPKIWNGFMDFVWAANKDGVIFMVVFDRDFYDSVKNRAGTPEGDAKIVTVTDNLP
ncbi:MAG: hypothetical protein NUV69_01195 [Candidatus Curtissbacteria bacterium]|nr:hypothetical protein [Candidatus Curtissbacteria bacterium]